ncbi:FAD/NAD(P)-binding domain-containing protein [Cryphonectria parasitica EP155]|uniref:FAD/NAD(P)-binding domain-containing protein n=1 Tax=Cryphonectria parasitica (strain ATCC 38755 / EP155) TaxID=660469 RepID=A0A9P4YAY7_CRYP1|nr:FAD/NAD(P)-binding domain-containing protein [Cryphonectria parasitica EP155]KAF3769690.1 FAD/NAD(P)-binding domain-containing protein [Cryphonectria parasitica EP155]
MGFKVIVIGGGLAGLGIAHCFAKAGIDYVVLERNEEICIPDGASMAMWPHNARILDQLGLLEGAQALDCHIKLKTNVRKDGSVIGKSNMMETIGKRLGHDWMCFHRPEFLKFLYDELPDREARILGGKALDKIETTSEGVRVTCKDGSVHEGSVVVGADGVNSSVRRHLANELSDPKLAKPFTTSYRGLFGWSTWTKGIEEGHLYEMHGDKMSVQLIPGKDMVMFLVYDRLPADTRESVRYSDEEKKKLVEEVAEYFVTDTVQFKDLWGQAQWSFCSGLEEGTAEKWYGDRLVLVGDTVHKMTPNVGLGLNSGWQSAAILTNGLRRLLQKNPEPSTEALNAVFKEYQEIRKKDASDMVEISGLYTRVVAWNNPVWKFVDQYVTKYIGGDNKLLDLLMIPMVRKGNALDFLNENHFRTGTTTWLKGQTVIPKELER